eukprot:TRINITY_DN8561_c0_g1_i2.p3 TRINITY_DN8561_c0_g1~~TRINITY_DN8561_c0_g1_i2.p3  ORF type:complete len:114 (-),score=21.00 TRINITY_DN8561_c0_g1_i2:107-448(-)
MLVDECGMKSRMYDLFYNFQDVNGFPMFVFCQLAQGAVGLYKHNNTDAVCRVFRCSVSNPSRPFSRGRGQQCFEEASSTAQRLLLPSYSSKFVKRWRKGTKKKKKKKIGRAHV